MSGNKRILILCIATNLIVLPGWQLQGIYRSALMRGMNSDIVTTTQVSSIANMSNLLAITSFPYVVGRVGYKGVILLGMIFYMMGTLMSAMAHDVYTLMFTWQFSQITQGFTQAMVQSIIPFQFKDNLAMQSSIIDSAFGLGVVIFSQIFSWIIEYLDQKWCLVIRCFMVVAIMIPNYFWMKPCPDGEEQDTVVSDSDSVISLIGHNFSVSKSESNINKKNSQIISQNLVTVNSAIKSDEIEVPMHNEQEQINKDISLQDLLSKRSIKFCIISIFLHSMNFKTIFELIVVFQQAKNQSQTDSSFMLTVMAFTSFVMRLCSALVLQFINIFQLYQLVGVLMGCSFFIMPLVDNYWCSVAICSIMSTGIAFFTSQVASLVYKLQPISWYKYAISQTFSVWDSGILIGCFISGIMVREVGYTQTFWNQGIIAFLGSFFMLLSEIEFNREQVVIVNNKCAGSNNI